jgi:hypothetical protein
MSAGIEGSSLQRETPDGFWAVPELDGVACMDALKWFHDTLKPKSYLEIGVGSGTSLGLAQCPSIAIDPNFRITSAVMNNKPACLFYRMESDDFFGRYDPCALVGQKIEMAFLDGFHWFEYLLRDFINVEKHCKRNSVVILHDCVPIDAHIARRSGEDTRFRDKSKYPSFWAGDVWKAAAIIRKYRPDLRMISFDAKPTGLVAITRLDPASKLLADGYFDYIDEFVNKDLLTYRDEYIEAIKLVSLNDYMTAQAVSTKFWL